MAAFPYGDDLQHPLDFEILAHWRGMVLYHSNELLNRDVAWLIGHGYAPMEFDCRAWTSEHAFHNDVAHRFGFPSWYGRNLDAFSDLLSEVELPDEGGLVIVLRALDRMGIRQNRFTQFLLEIFADEIWHQMLFGRRMLLLVQSDDPDIELPTLDGHKVEWNGGEAFGRNGPGTA